MALDFLTPLSYDQLPGWENDPCENLKKTLQHSLLAIAENHRVEISGKIYDFSPFLKKLEDEKEVTHAFIETYLQPYGINHTTPELFTGYYEPVLKASYTKEREFSTPIYKRPLDLFYIPDLGIYNKHLKGERLAGKLQGTELLQYSTRGEIYKGALGEKASILAWAHSPIEFYFLQVQGSGVLEFPDEVLWRIGYSATNGHPYKSISKHLFEEGVLQEKDRTMEGVKAYLRSLSQEGLFQTLAYNPSYIFFERRETKSPVGSHKVELVAHRSLAVDPKYIPLGIPLWLDCDHPETGRIQRIVLAHDTGSAIKGAVRGDYFWGTGETAGAFAGKMKSKGHYFLLLPRL